MIKIPKFEEFQKLDQLIESADFNLQKELHLLEKADPIHSVNEGSIMNTIKNSLSKFFLGPLSRVGMIDDARKVILDLEMDIIEQKHKKMEEIGEIEDQLSSLSKSTDMEKIKALIKDKESKSEEIRSYIKQQELKIKKSFDFVRKAIDGSQRRREYFEVGRADDQIALAELEYKLAKERGEQSNLKKLEDKIHKAKEQAQKKAEHLSSEIESEGEKKISDGDLKVDPEKEKKKIGTRKVRDIIKRRNELSKEIIDLKQEIEKMLKSLKRKVDSKTLKPNQAKNYMMDLLELSSALDSKKNLLKLLTGIGKDEKEISTNLQSETEFTKLTNKINQSITDGQDANTGTKKIISGLFSVVNREGRGDINPEKIKLAIEKINR